MDSPRSKEFSPYMVALCPMLVRVCMIPKEKLSYLMSSLVKIFFFQDREDANGLFVSIGETLEEVFLLLDSVSFDLLSEDEKNQMDIRKEYVRPLRIQVSSLGTGSVSAFSTALANSGITIFYYSSANSDYLLLEESDIEKAKSIISSQFPVIWSDENQDVDEIFNQSQSFETIEAVPTPVQTSANTEWKMLCSYPDFPIQIAVLPEDTPNSLFKELIRLIFYTKRKRFYCYSQIQKEFSLIADFETIKSIQIETSTSDWIPVKRRAKYGFRELGVISHLSFPLKKLAILYLSTFKSAYLFINKDHFPEACQIYKTTDIVMEQCYYG